MSNPKIERCPECGKVPEVKYTHLQATGTDLFAVNCCDLSAEIWYQSTGEAINAWNDSPDRLRAEIEVLREQLREAVSLLEEMQGYIAGCEGYGNLPDEDAFRAPVDEISTEAKVMLEASNE